jgi:ParB family transcriptional regulator, chromosome partitioning protein
MENKVLGKGLSALIPQRRESSISGAMAKVEGGEISSLEINLIKNNPLQPRRKYDEAKLEELKASIKEKGILQPILVRPAGNGYEVIAGERRLRAARALGLTQVPVVVKNATDREALVLALVENIQRAELNAIEEAQGFKRLIEDFSFTQESVATSVGKDRSTITNLLRLLKLPVEIQDYVADGRLSMGHARALLSVDDSRVQKKMAEDVVAKSLSVRQVEALVKKVVEGEVKKDKPVSSASRDIQILEEELSRLLGTKVIVENKNNKGRVIVEYYSLDDFDRILGVMRK